MSRFYRRPFHARFWCHPTTHLRKSIFLEKSEDKTKETHFEIGLGVLYLWYKNQLNLFFSQKSLVVSKMQSHLRIEQNA